MKKWVLIGFIAAITWFIPWVFSFYFGMIIYFPYKADGDSRYVRVTGPLPASLGLDSSWTPEDEIPALCRASLIGAEDGRFLEHSGIDPDSIQQAIKRNKKKGKTQIGASTITQQLVKNVFLYRDKTYLRKSREIVGAVLLDLIMSKNRQLTWYLNVVEFGPEIYGIREASRYYFKKAPSKLTFGECASLVALLRDPVKSSKWLKSKNIPEYLAKRRDRIMTNVIQWGLLNKLKELQ